MVFNFVIEQFGVEYLFKVIYPVSLILAVIAYKLGFARKLPIIKSIIVYILLAIGIFILYPLFIAFPVASGGKPLYLVESLFVICVVLAIYRIRLHFQRKAKKTS